MDSGIRAQGQDDNRRPLWELRPLLKLWTNWFKLHASKGFPQIRKLQSALPCLIKLRNRWSLFWTNPAGFDLRLEIIFPADSPTGNPAQHRYLTDVC